MQRILKFRAWTGDEMLYEGWNKDFFATKETIFRYENVMQYSGLKDKEGKEIYEGDIFGSAKLRCVVKREDDGRYVLEFLDKRIKPISILDQKVSKSGVVGNIYENANLLTP